MIKNTNESCEEKVIKQEMIPVTIPDFVQRIAIAICSEHQAIAEYDTILGDMSICENTRAIIEEIRQDEVDHARLLSCLLKELTCVTTTGTEETCCDNVCDNCEEPEEAEEIVDEIPVEDTDELTIISVPYDEDDLL